MPELKPCPFCGSTKLKVQSKSVLDGYIDDICRVERMTFSVRCNSCHARGGTASGRVIELFRLTMTEKDLPEWAISDTKLKEKAIEAWNSRKENKNVLYSTKFLTKEEAEKALKECDK